MKFMNINKDKMINFLFYFSYLFFVLMNMTRWVNNISFIHDIIKVILYPLLIIIILLQVTKFNFKSIIKVMIITSIFFLSYYVTKDLGIIFILLFVIAAKHINLKNFITYDLIIKIIFLIFIILLYYLGLTQNNTIYDSLRGTRYAFGFGHPNTFAVYILNICSDLVYLNYGKKNIKVYFILLLLGYFIDRFCDSRTSFFVIIISIFLSLSINKLSKFKLNKKIITYIFPVALFITVLFVSYFINNPGNSLLKSVDRLLSYRLSLFSTFYQAYPIKLFGNEFINYNTCVSLSTCYVLDNIYLTLILKYGLLLTILLCLGFVARFKMALKNNEMSLVICLLIYIIHGFMENSLFILSYNPFLICFSVLIWDIYEKNMLEKGCKNENKKISN